MGADAYDIDVDIVFPNGCRTEAIQVVADAYDIVVDIAFLKGKLKHELNKQWV